MDSLKKYKNIENLCRICLTQSKTMISLNSPLNTSADSPSVIEALQKVLSVKITYGNKYPMVICPMCLGLLKLSYELKLQFLNSQNILQEHFKDNSQPLDDIQESYDLSNQVSKLSPVEIIVGQNKYSLNDVVIVEEDKEDRGNFKGFLDNLGKTVTARFVDKSGRRKSKMVPEDPILLIERIDRKDFKNDLSETQDKNKSVNKLDKENVDQYIITQGEDCSGISKTGISKGNLNLEKFGLKDLSDIDQDLFRSALSIQLKCENCQKLYSSRKRFQRHLNVCEKMQYRIIENKQGEPVITPLPVVLNCNLCSRTFNQKKYLNFHIKRVHNMDSIYTCEVCGLTLRNRSAFTYHKRTKHGERKFPCEMCPLKFFTPSSLKTHLRNHTQRNVAQCVCPVCGKTFHYKGGLFYHMKLHTNERKYCCKFCDKKFYTLMSMKRHTLTHTGVRPYSCSFCGKRFCSSSELRKHEHLHTGFRPYRCSYCNKGFSSTYNMKLHLAIHPGPFSCKYCDRTFISSSVLKFHLKMKHSIVEPNS